MIKQKTVLAVVMVVTAVIVLGFLGYIIVGERNAIENLKVELVDVSISSVRLSSCDLSLRLKFINPTWYDTPTFWIESYSIYVNDILVGVGTLPPTKVPANSTVYRTTVITIEYKGIAAGIISAILTGKPTVKIEGTIEAKVLFNTFSISKQFSITYDA